MAIASGMTSAIMNPTNPNELHSIYAANLLMNRDKNGANWIKRNRLNSSDSSSIQDTTENSQRRRRRRNSRR